MGGGGGGQHFRLHFISSSLQLLGGFCALRQFLVQSEANLLNSCFIDIDEPSSSSYSNTD